MTEAEDQYDYIVIDTPPVNVVSDALGMASFIGGILLVTRYRVTTTKEVDAALQAISVTGAPVLGMVLTEVDFKQGGYYKKYYKKDYKSYTESAVKTTSSAKNLTDSKKQSVS